MSPSLLEKLSNYRRDAWVPETEEAEAVHNAADKFGGLPYLRNTDDWPRCSNCGRHMNLFVQLDLSRLPEKKGNGLAQFFYCTSSKPLCEVDCEAYFPNTSSMSLRIIDVKGDSAMVKPDMEEMFPQRNIVGWTRKDDYPNWEELSEMGAELSDEESDELCDSDFPLAGDKLFGWPCWVQGVEYHLPDSELFVQIDSERNVPYMFGDVGCGHVTRAKDDVSKMAFGWACG